MNVEVIIFDLDDTLYDEIDFVKSGFKEVSKYFSQKYNFEYEIFYQLLFKNLEKFGRGKVFDKVLKYFNIYSKKNILKAVSIYRTHKPSINLPQNSIYILNYFNKINIPIYIVTDGNKIVQNNKIEALKLRKYIKKDFITHRYGIKYAKPSTYCFLKIAKLEKIDLGKIAYIADNPNKDFINIKKLGFRTIRIKQGMFKNLKKTEEYEAEINIKSLKELKNIIKV
ncbi:HAD family hydrolase [Aliarcobacter butzleri]|uniref:HAD family hydrolase n=1 Tax=Aliarcobacter butzleri TaxID=28197 RepID=UPI003B2117D8